MRIYSNIFFGVGMLCALCSCDKKPPNLIAINEILQAKGLPAAIASDYKISQVTGLSTITLYGVNKRVSTEAIKQLTPGQMVVFSLDPRFIRTIGYHFNNMHDPTQYSGSTMFLSLFTNGTNLTIFRIVENGKAELQCSQSVSVVYLEVGDKDHLVRVTPKI